MPSLLAVARAAQDWMEAGLTERPDPLHALLAAIGRHAGQGPAHSVFLPVWAAYPAVGFAPRDALPGLRSDAADRVAGRGQPVTWPLAFLHLVAESARMGLRDSTGWRRPPSRAGRSWPEATNARGCPTRSTRCCGCRR